ncbi:phosphatidylinositol 4,5-bisphosphate-binding protein [Martiniozyma asiatica (nom. inval.)]|nr:phosphatidylinositol 4,5-bisphosphate-binding protein [Martiniozyma asiatica]
MSLVSQQQLLQNQLKLKQLDDQRKKQNAQSKSMTSGVSEVSSNQHKRNASSAQTPNFADPLSITIPTNSNPTEILASRFSTWRNIISALSHYLQEVVSVNEEQTRQQIRLHHAITFPFVAQGLDGDYYQPLRVQNNPSRAGGSHQLFHSTKENGNAVNAEFNEFDVSKQNNEFDIAKKFFMPLGSGSIQDLPTILYQFHSQAALLSQNTVKELNASVIPRLEDLKRDLLVKIKEIKSLQTDFKNNVNRLHSDTQAALREYTKAIQIAKDYPTQIDPKQDPYMLKSILDRSIRRQLTEENFLHEAFNNLQSSGKELEKVVYIELQSALTIYAKLVGQQAQNVFDGLLAKLDSSILTKDPAIEWETFVSNDFKNFVSPNLPMRHISEISYNNQSDPLIYDYRNGYLERKSKYLKSYAKGFYVLTSCFLHEFKTSDRKKDPIPVISLPISDLRVIEHSRRDDINPDGLHKFVITSNSGGSGGLLGRNHKFVFRCDGYENMMQWYNDIKKLSSLPSPVVRSSIILERRKQKRLLNSNSIVNVAGGVGNNLSGKNSTVSSIRNVNRQRGVSSVTDKTDRSLYTETLNESSATSQLRSSNPGLININDSLANHSAVNFPVTDDYTTVNVNVNGAVDAQVPKIELLPENENHSLHTKSFQSQNTQKASDYSLSKEDVETQKAQILEEQAILEQKQRELQQRALSLSSLS